MVVNLVTREGEAEAGLPDLNPAVTRNPSEIAEIKGSSHASVPNPCIEKSLKFQKKNWKILRMNRYYHFLSD